MTKAEVIWVALEATLKGRGVFTDMKPEYMAEIKQECIEIISLLLPR